jgi:hypothetical protein
MGSRPGRLRVEVALSRIVGRFLILVMLTAAAVVLVRLLRGSHPDVGAGRSELSAELPDDEPPDDPDLTLVKGIGPVYRERLTGIGIVGSADLSRADPAQVAAAAGIPESRARDWITQAAALHRR